MKLCNREDSILVLVISLFYYNYCLLCLFWLNSNQTDFCYSAWLVYYCVWLEDNHCAFISFDHTYIYFLTRLPNCHYCLTSLLQQKPWFILGNPQQPELTLRSLGSSSLSGFSSLRLPATLVLISFCVNISKTTTNSPTFKLHLCQVEYR